MDSKLTTEVPNSFDASACFFDFIEFNEQQISEDKLIINFTLGSFANSFLFLKNESPTCLDKNIDGFFIFFSSFLPYFPINEQKYLTDFIQICTKNTYHQASLYNVFITRLFYKSFLKQNFSISNAFPEIVFDFQKNIPPQITHIFENEKYVFNFTLNTDKHSIRGALSLHKTNDKLFFSSLNFQDVQNTYESNFYYDIQTSFLALCKEHSYFLPLYMYNSTLFSTLQSLIQKELMRMITENEYLKLQQMFNAKFPQL